MSNAQLLNIAIPTVFGVIVGMLLGRYFCFKEYFNINVTKNDLEKALVKSYISDEELNEEAAKEAVHEAVEEVETKISEDIEEGNNYYRVNLSTFVMAEDHVEALGRVLGSLKRRRNLFFKEGAIDIHNTYVEKLEVEEDDVDGL